MKSLSFSVLFFGLLLSLGLHLSTAQETPTPATVYLDIPPEAIVVGSDFTVNISIDTSEPVYAGEIELSFNPDKLEVSSIAAGDFFAAGGVELFNEFDNIAGSAHYGYSLLGNVDQPVGTGVVAKITFRVLASGETRLGIRKADFSHLIISEGNPPGSEPVQTSFIEELTLFIQDANGAPATPTPTDTPTPTATFTPSNTPTPTATPTTSSQNAEDTNDALPIIIGAVAIIGILLLSLLLWRRGKQKAPKIADAKAASTPIHARLTYYDCTDPKEPYKGNREFELRQTVNRIGRDKSESANIVVRYSALSRFHAEIVRKAPFMYVVRDMNSLNGTFVLNVQTGERIRLEPAEAHPLEHGNLIFFGEYLSFRFGIESMQDGQGEGRTTRSIDDFKL